MSYENLKPPWLTLNDLTTVDMSPTVASYYATDNKITIVPGSSYNNNNNNNNYTKPEPDQPLDCESACPMCAGGQVTPNEPLVAAIPALAKIIPCPCGCAVKRAIWETVIHLNDRMQWTREQIADWLDTLSVDLRFKLPESPESTEGNS